MSADTVPIFWQVRAPLELADTLVDAGEMFAALVEVARYVAHLGITFLDPDSIAIHTGPHHRAELYAAEAPSEDRLRNIRDRYPYAARVFHGHADAHVDHVAARLAIARLEELLERLPERLLRPEVAQG